MKIIIECRDGIEPEDALRRVRFVVGSGKCYELRGYMHYAWHSEWPLDGIEVIVRQKKSKTAADSFIVRKMVEVRG